MKTRQFTIPSLFGPMPERPEEKPGAGRPINLGLLGGIIAIPLLLVGALLSYPYTWTRRFVQNRNEAGFRERMNQTGRTIPWDEAKRAAAQQTGTLLCETLSIKGPSRLWWTSGIIAEITPFPFAKPSDNEFAFFEKEFIPFANWCREKYTDPVSGTAKLVVQPGSDKKAFWREARQSGLIQMGWINQRAGG